MGVTERHPTYQLLFPLRVAQQTHAAPKQANARVRGFCQLIACCELSFSRQALSSKPMRALT
eukprot:5439207-Amphidinium_carterae.1